MTMCQRCRSFRTAKVNAKCDDRFSIELIDKVFDQEYAPRDMGIGNGDYVSFAYCLDCGQIQGRWPLPQSVFENIAADEREDEPEECEP